MESYLAQKFQEIESGAARRRYAEEYAKTLGRSVTWVYEQARKGGWESGRAARKDKGVLKSGLTDEQLNAFSNLLHKPARRNRKNPAPVTDVHEVAVDSGILAEGQITAQQMARILRDKKISKRHAKAPTPHIELAAAHTNHAWQVDATACIQYFFKDNGNGMGQRDTKTDFYHGKPGSFKDIKKHLIRYAAIDHLSRSFYIQYFYSSGEKATDILEFLWAACSAKPDPEAYPFRGVPLMLMGDKGSGFNDGMVQTLLKNLDVEWTYHLPGNPRAKGMVEGLMNIWEQHFEWRLAHQPAPDLETLNAWALDRCTHLNATIPMERCHGATRSGLWSTITEEQLRLLPSRELYQELCSAKPESRQVSRSGLFRFRGEEYRMPDVELFGEAVEVTFDAYNYPHVRARSDEKVYLCQPITRDFAGRSEKAVMIGAYKRHKDTETQKGLKTAENAWAEDPPPLQLFGHQAEKVKAVGFLPRQGQEIEIEQDDSPVMIPFVQAMKQVYEALGRRITEKENRAVRERFGESVPVEAISEIVDWLSGEEEERQAEIA